MDFSSDNSSGVAPWILEAIAKANVGTVGSYGGDAITEAAVRRVRDVFECEAAVYFVTTGGAANGLALSVLTPPYGVIFCHEASHVQIDECGGPEFYTHGAKLLPLPGPSGKITPEALERALSFFAPGFVHHAQPKTLSLTQSTENGTVYDLDALGGLCALAHERGLTVHMDGARFANALVTLGCTPAEATWKAGLDVLVLGATKNGAMAAEAVIFFDPDKAADFEFRRKRAGHLLSKSRFLSAQIDAYLTDNLWLDLAAHANAMARKLNDGLTALPGVTTYYPVEANEIFIRLPEPMRSAAAAAGAKFHPWIVPGDPANGEMIRMVTSFMTSEEDVDAFLRTATSATGVSRSS